MNMALTEDQKEGLQYVRDRQGVPQLFDDTQMIEVLWLDVDCLLDVIHTLEVDLDVATSALTKIENIAMHYDQ
jgi:hypothetical protein